MWSGMVHRRGWCGELAELFFVSFDAFGEGFDGGAQVSDFGGDAGQRSGVGLSGSDLVNDENTGLVLHLVNCGPLAVHPM